MSTAEPPSASCANEPKAPAVAANLIRVRNNQRRSRALRRDYVAELERKVQDYESNGFPTRAVVPETTLRRLMAENAKLRELLQQAGIGATTIKNYLGIASDGSNGSIQSSSEHLQKEVDTLSMPSRTSPEISLALAALQGTTGVAASAIEDGMLDEAMDVSGDTLNDLYATMPHSEFDSIFDPILEMSGSALSLSPHPLPEFCPSRVTDDTPPALDTAMKADPPLCADLFLDQASSHSSSGTTLCSEAFEMLQKQNLKGFDMMEIGIRLFNGFIKGEGSSGCRVENSLLVGVLEYISG